MDKYQRQSFLGADSQDKIGNCVVGIVGLGGGGSHIVQQLAHLGFMNFRLFDPDSVEYSNLNRLVGATAEDADSGRLKIDIAARLIRGLHPTAIVKTFATSWQQNALELRDCQMVFGCLDSFSAREQLERCLRRFFVPYIDIGMDVHEAQGKYRLAGQVIVSMPGHPCMWCLGYLSDDKLALEASKYGSAGGRPQVIWANGLLASCAVGLAVEVLTGWTQSAERPHIYLSLDGNRGLISIHPRLEFLAAQTCDHFRLNDVGEPKFQSL